MAFLIVAGILVGAYLLAGMCLATVIALDETVAEPWAGELLWDRIGMLLLFVLLWPAYAIGGRN